MSRQAQPGASKGDAALLASLGYKQEFKREFKSWELFGVAFSIIGLVPSIASVLFNSIPNGGGPAMVWGWLVAGIFDIFISLSVAELGSAAPTSGGLYFWTFALAPPNSRNLLCWIVGYANTLGNIAGFASIAWGCASQIMAAAMIGSSDNFSPTSAQLFGVYAAVIISQAVIGAYGTQLLARLQTLYIVFNVLLILVIIIALPVATPYELKNQAKFALGDFYNAYDWPNGFAFILSFLAPLWSVCGFDSTVHISEEASNASIAVPSAIVGSAVVSIVFGWGINLALAFCMGTDYDAIMGGQQPMATIFYQSFGQKPTLAIWAFVVILQYMMGTSMILVTSRQVFAFGRDNALPFSWWLYQMNKRTGTPTNTVWFSAGLALILGLLAFAGPQAIGAVFTLGVAGLYFSYTIPICLRVLWGRGALRPGPFNLGALSVPISTIAALFMCIMIVVFMFPAAPRSSSTDMNYSAVVFGGVMILSLGWYYFPKYGGVHWFTGPVKNIDICIQGVNNIEKPDDEKVEMFEDVVRKA